jgi:hypothetical protein
MCNGMVFYLEHAETYYEFYLVGCILLRYIIITLFKICLQSQLKFLLLYSSFSHSMFRSLQVKYNITYTIEVPSLLQRVRCSLIVYLCDKYYTIIITYIYTKTQNF